MNKNSKSHKNYDNRTRRSVLVGLAGAAAATTSGGIAAAAQAAVRDYICRVPETKQRTRRWEEKRIRAGLGDEVARIRAGRAFLAQLPYEPAEIESADGLRLRARLYERPGAHAALVLCHGFHSAGVRDFAVQFPWLYEDGGYHLLLIDQRTHGESEGEAITFGPMERYDVARWCGWMRARFPALPLALFGVSMGAASALMAAQLPELHGRLACITADCSFAALEGVARHSLQKSMPMLPPEPALRFAARCGVDIEQANVLRGMTGYDTPTLFIHGAADDFVPCAHTQRLYAACSAPKRLLLVPGAQHAMSAAAAPETYRAALLAFLDEYTS